VNRRDFILVLGGAAALPPAARAQQTSAIPAIGFLSMQFAASPGLRVEAFRTGLRDLGYSEPTTISIDYRFADFQPDRLPALANELVQRKVAIIVALEPPGARAATAATKTIPIVMRSTLDPVHEGFVASLARPGGNVTGLASESAELHGKRIELLRELDPTMKRLAVLVNSAAAATRWQLGPIGDLARSSGMELIRVEAAAEDRLDAAIASAAQQGARGMIAIRDPVFVANRAKLAALAAAHRLLAVYDEREYADAGGLLSYGANLADVYRRAAAYVDKILKGAKPADLPVEQPTKFELVLNLKTAKALGLTVPRSILLRADEVIE